MSKLGFVEELIGSGLSAAEAEAAEAGGPLAAAAALKIIEVAEELETKEDAPIPPGLAGIGPEAFQRARGGIVDIEPPAAEPAPAEPSDEPAAPEDTPKRGKKRTKSVGLEAIIKFLYEKNTSATFPAGLAGEVLRNVGRARINRAIEIGKRGLEYDNGYDKSEWWDAINSAKENVDTIDKIIEETRIAQSGAQDPIEHKVELDPDIEGIDWDALLEPGADNFDEDELRQLDEQYEDYFNRGRDEAGERRPLIERAVNEGREELARRIQAYRGNNPILNRLSDAAIITIMIGEGVISIPSIIGALQPGEQQRDVGDPSDADETKDGDTETKDEGDDPGVEKETTKTIDTQTDDDEAIKNTSKAPKHSVESRPFLKPGTTAMVDESQEQSRQDFEIFSMWDHNSNRMSSRVDNPSDNAGGVSNPLIMGNLVQDAIRYHDADSIKKPMHADPFIWVEGQDSSYYDVVDQSGLYELERTVAQSTYPFNNAPINQFAENNQVYKDINQPTTNIFSRDQFAKPNSGYYDFIKRKPKKKIYQQVVNPLRNR